MTAPDPRLDAIKDRLGAATPGPWHLDRDEPGEVASVVAYERNDGVTIGTYIADDVESDGDATFIANAPADVAHLLSVVEAQAGQIAKVRELHRPVEVFEYDDSNGTFKQDGDGEQIVMKTLCTSCTGASVLESIGDCEYDDLDYHDETHWPCPTIAALAPEGPEA